MNIKENIYDRQKNLGLNTNQIVIVAGLGGIGSWIMYLLSLVGVRFLIGIDPDTIEKTNLNRTPFKLKDVDSTKVQGCINLISESREIFIANDISTRDEMIPAFVKKLQNYPELNILAQWYATDYMPNRNVITDVVFNAETNIEINPDELTVIEKNILTIIDTLQLPVSYIDATDTKVGLHPTLYEKMKHVLAVGYDGDEMSFFQGDYINHMFSADSNTRYTVTPSYAIPPIMLASLAVDYILNPRVKTYDTKDYHLSTLTTYNLIESIISNDKISTETKPYETQENQENQEDQSLQPKSTNADKQPDPELQPFAATVKKAIKKKRKNSQSINAKKTDKIESGLVTSTGQVKEVQTVISKSGTAQVVTSNVKISYRSNVFSLEE